MISKELRHWKRPLIKICRVPNGSATYITICIRIAVHASTHIRINSSISINTSIANSIISDIYVEKGLAPEFPHRTNITDIITTSISNGHGDDGNNNTGDNDGDSNNG